MSRRCSLTGKGRNVAYKVSHANNHTKTVQLPNIRLKRLWLESEKRFIRIRVSARALRTVSEKGLDRYMKELGLTLKDLT